MKFRSENGFTGIDITVAVIVVTLFMSLISVVFYNITISAKKSERKTESTYIATSLIEEIKSKDYDEIIETNVDENNDWVNVNNYTIEDTEGNSTKILSTTIEEGYTAKIKVEIYNTNNSSYDLVKQVSVIVEYKIGKETENVQLNTTIVRN